MTAAEFARVMPDVAKFFWGEPNDRLSNGKELRWGNNGARSVDIDKGTFFDHEANEGGGVVDLLKREGIADPLEWLRQNGFADRDNGAGAKPKIVATYDYTDEAGELLFQVVRLEPKTFRQRRPARPDDPPDRVKDGWVWSVKGVRQVPFRLPELIEAIALGRRVFVVEGEKDVLRLARLGIVATCNAMGAGKWKVDLAEHFGGADVIVIPDNDYTGRNHANDVARSLAGTAARVRLLKLPGLLDKGDVSDWLAAGGTVEAFNDLVEPAPNWMANSAAPSPADRDLPADAAPQRAKPRLIDAAAWHGLQVPQRSWTVQDRVPRRNVTLASGAGAVGKSTLFLQLSAAHVIQLSEAYASCGYWFGSMPVPGRVLYVTAEEDEDELHFRTAAIATHLGAPLSALKGLHFMPLAGEDALLGVPDHSGIIRATNLLGYVREAALDLKAVAVIIDTAADTFGGNENDRAQVRQFIGLLRGLAIAADAGVILISHPSVAGMKGDTGTSGSTAWENSARARMYFKIMAADGDDAEPQADTDLRELVIKKANYGPSGEHIRMRWQNGLFVPIGTPSSLDKLAVDRKAEQAFLDLLKRFTEQNQTVGPNQGPNYAPAKFAAHPDGKPFSSKKLAAAMQRLLDARTIKIEAVGPPSKLRSQLVRT